MELDERIKTTERAKNNIDLVEKEIDRVTSELTHKIYHPEINTLIPSENSLRAYLNNAIYQIYIDLIETSVVNNYSIVELVSGSTYYICRDDNIPRTLKEISYVCLSEYYPPEDRGLFEPRPSWTPYMKRTVRTHRRICDILEINTTPVDSIEFIRRYTQELGLDQEVEEVSRVILMELDNRKKSGVPTYVLAAGIIKVACDQIGIELPIWNGMASKIDVSPDSIYTQCQNIENSL